MNERITENLVRDQLAKHGFTGNPNLVIDEQRSSHKQIHRLLKEASKSGPGRGMPEFIIREAQAANTLIVIECKADKGKHCSATLTNPKDYAVDGALHYAKHLSSHYRVIAVGVSGEKKPLVTMYLCVGDTVQKLPIESFQPWQDLIHAIAFDPQVIQETEKQLMKFSNILHNYIRDHLKLSESQKPLLVGACLVALQNPDYREGVNVNISANQQLKKIKNAIESELEKARIAPDKIKTILQPLDSLFNEKSLQSQDQEVSAFNEMLDMLYRQVKPLVGLYKNFDILGHFYQEFLSYTAGDKKSLGIVLTPQHVTKLFCELAEVNTSSVIFDNCTGTGGFLIAGMASMIEQTKGDTDIIKSIKSKQLIGVELQTNMFALACLNMMLKGDGKSNLYNANCFSIKDDVKRKKPTVGMLNPPYAQKAAGLSELYFIENNLDCLQPGGISVAIVPLSVAITGNQTHRQEVMAKHTLLACMTMSPDLFTNVGVHSCIMVWQAHKPHNPNRPTWFALWKDDGFIKTKTGGRCDHYNRWPAIKEQWLDSYFAKQVISGQSTLQKIGAEDEWCVEAYLEPDYSNLTKGEFQKTTNEFEAFRIANANLSDKSVNTTNWQTFKIVDLFKVEVGNALSIREAKESPGKTPYVSCSETNNGIVCLCGLEPKYPTNTITLSKNGAVGKAFYQDTPYIANADIFVLTPKFEMTKKHQLFIIPLLELNKGKYSYGRKLSTKRIQTDTIKLPVKDNEIDWEWID